MVLLYFVFFFFKKKQHPNNLIVLGPILEGIKMLTSLGKTMASSTPASSDLRSNFYSDFKNKPNN